MYLLLKTNNPSSEEAEEYLEIINQNDTVKVIDGSKCFYEKDIHMTNGEIIDLYTNEDIRGIYYKDEEGHEGIINISEVTEQEIKDMEKQYDTELLKFL